MLHICKNYDPLKNFSFVFSEFESLEDMTFTIKNIVEHSCEMWKISSKCILLNKIVPKCPITHILCNTTILKTISWHF